MDWIAAGFAALAVALYVKRINHLRWTTHKAACVAAQTVGAVAAAASIYSAGGGDTFLAWLCLIVCWVHLAATSDRWRVDPKAQDSRTMPWNGIPH